MTVSEWLIKFLRNCPHLPGFLLYNSIGEDSDAIAVVESIGQAKATRFVNGSYISINPFMLLMRANQNEADEIEMQNIFSNIARWIDEQSVGSVDEGLSILEIEPATNLAPAERDDQGNITYQAIFNVKYFVQKKYSLIRIY